MTDKSTAEKVRELVENQPPRITKADLRRAIGMVDRHTFDARWNGEKEFTVEQVKIMAAMLGVNPADLI